MIELTRTENAVLASWLEMRLAGLGIKAYLFDGYTSTAYGLALDAVQCRVMVAEEDLPRARQVLEEAALRDDGSGPSGDGDA